MPSGSRSGLIMKKLSRHLIFTASLFAIASDAAVLPASPFADNMVLQRGMRVPVALWTKGLVSAVGFYYALALHDAIDVPVGLVDVSWGGSRIEPWIAPDGGMWNGMVAAFAPMACRGFIWYQGCANRKDGAGYAKKMHSLYDNVRRTGIDCGKRQGKNAEASAISLQQAVDRIALFRRFSIAAGSI